MYLLKYFYYVFERVLKMKMNDKILGVKTKVSSSMSGHYTVDQFRNIDFVKYFIKS